MSEGVQVRGSSVHKLGLPEQSARGQVAYTTVTYSLHRSGPCEAKAEVFPDAFSLECPESSLCPGYSEVLSLLFLLKFLEWGSEKERLDFYVTENMP